MKRLLVALLLIAAVLLPAPVQAGVFIEETAAAEWKIWSSGTTTQNLYSISMVSANDGWAVGAGGTALHWDGSAWSAFPTGVTSALLSVDMLTSNEGWAVGEGGILLHWNGIAWKRDTTSDGNGIYNMRAVSVFSPMHAWAVGDWDSRPRAMHFNGYRWEAWELPQDSIPRSISIIDEEVGYVVGDNGTILTKQLGDWVGVASPTEFHLNAVITNSIMDGWAVGNEGEILHRIFSIWFALETPTSASLKSISTTPTSGLWSVGSGGTILRGDSSAWQLVSSPTSANLKAVGMVSDSDGWAVGDGGIILRYTSQNPVPGLASLSPAAMPAGANGGVLVVNGSFFSTNSVVLWNGEALPTAYISDLKLAAQVPASKLAAAGYNTVTVTSPAPGGGSSSSLICEVLDLPIALFLPLIHLP